MKKNKNKRGFTLIELLAVIIILGVLMLIAIPSVTEYISDSRKKTYINSAKQYITGVMIKVNSLEYVFTDISTTYYVPIECIKLEKGGKSPFGEWKNAYVVVTFDGNGYNYYWTSVDVAGYGVLTTVENDLIKDRVLAGVSDIEFKAVGSTNKVGIIDKDVCSSSVSSTSTRSSVIGNIVEDIKLGNDATIIGATYDAVNGFMHFDGIDDYINVGYAGYDFGSDATMIARVKINDDIPGVYSYIIGNPENGGLSINITPSYKFNSSYFIQGDSAYTDNNSTNNVILDRWYTIVSVYDGSSNYLYIDGVLINKVDKVGMIKVSPMPLLLGGQPDGTSTSVIPNGLNKMDLEEVVLFDRAVSSGEVASNYSNSINISNNSDMLFHYKFK